MMLLLRFDFLALILSLVVLGLSSVHAEDKSTNESRDRLIAYSGEPPDVHITDEEQNLLENGEAIFKRIEFEDSFRGIALFRVNASPEKIWSVINNVGCYPQWIDDVEEATVYRSQSNRSHVRFTVSGLLGSKISWHAILDYPQRLSPSSQNWGTWQLDDAYQSDLEDSVGFWRVLPVHGKANVSDVIYSADIRLKGFFGSLFESVLIDNSLRDATQWVKVQAEGQSRRNCCTDK